MGGLLDETAMASAADPSGNYFVTGNFQDSMDIDPGAGVSLLTTTNDPFLNDIFLAKYDATGALLWGFGLGSNKNDEGWDVATDAAGNVYLGGEFTHTVDFDPGPGTTALSSSFSGGQMFVAKYSPAGALLWARHIAGITSGDNGVTAIALDGSGNVYMQGYFQGAIDVDPGAGVVSVSDGGGTSMCLVKLDASGNYVWGFGVGNAMLASSMDVDAAGNVVTSGEVFATSDMDPSAGTATLTVQGTSDIFIAKYNSAGAHQWSYSLGSANAATVNTECGREVRFLSGGDIVLAGMFRDTYDADPSGSTYSMTSAGGADIFVARFTGSGSWVWTYAVGNSTDEYLYAMDVDGMDHLYFVSKMFGAYDLQPGPATVNYFSNHIPIITWDASGNYLGHYTSITDGGAYRIVNGLEASPTGDLVLAGRFGGSVNCDSALTPAHEIMGLGGYTDALLVTYGATITSAAESLHSPGLAIGPNPVAAQGRLSISCGQPMRSLALTTLQGSVILTQPAHGCSAIEWPLDASIASGMYLLRVETTDGTAITRRVILQ